MKSYSIRFTPAAQDDLAAIFDHVAQRAGPAIAEAFVLRLEEACLALDLAPMRGAARDDLRPGLRTFGVERRATVLFTVDEKRAESVILGVFYGGRDVESLAVFRGSD